MFFVALTLALLSGAGLADTLRHGHRTTALAVATGLSGAAATAEWVVVAVGAVIGALVGVVIDTPSVSVAMRLRMFVASLGLAVVVTLPLVDRLGWSHSQQSVLLVAAACAFVAWPFLRAIRSIDWQRIVDRLIAARTPKE